MSKELLNIVDLSASVDGKEILNKVNLTINYGEVHVLMGPNGSGKTTLSNVIMNNPLYEVTGGDIFMDGESILEDSTDERAKKGIFMSFQHPEEIPGVNVEDFIRTANASVTGANVPILKFNKDLKAEMEELSMDPSYAQRYLNVGFSGGEKKKNEILQMLMLEPKFAILDETDSGLDVDATRIVSEGIEKFLSEDNAALIITHHKNLIDNIKPDFVHVIVDGRIVKTGDSSIIDRIEKDGFNWIREGE